MNRPLIARKRSTGCIPTRYVLAILGHIGFANVYALRVNLSVAIIDMKDQYGWSSQTEGLILSSFFFGYIFTQVPGGWLAERYGGKWVMGLGCLGTVVLSVLTPLAAHYGLGYLIALRVLEGFGEGVTFPAMHSMWSRWAPPYERTILTTLCYTGAWMGNIIAFPLSGVLAQNGFISEGHRWPSIFYVFGAVGFLWCIAWFSLVHSYPATHPRISAEERNFIESSISQKTEVVVPTPWRAIMTSPAFWSVIVSHLCNNWAAYTLLTNMPTFFKDVHNIGIMKGGIFSALPYVVIVIVIPSGGTLTDFMRRAKILSTTKARKLMNFLGQVLPAVFLIGTGFASSQALAVVLLAISVGFNGLSYSGFNVNHLDIAPRFAGTLMGITNTAGTISGIVAPYVAGALASAPSGTHVLAEEWRNVFYLGAEIQIFGALVFLILGSGEEQWWANGTSMPDSPTSSLSLPHEKVQRDF